MLTYTYNQQYYNMVSRQYKHASKGPAGVVWFESLKCGHFTSSRIRFTVSPFWKRGDEGQL